MSQPRSSTFKWGNMEKLRSIRNVKNLLCKYMRLNGNLCITFLFEMIRFLMSGMAERFENDENLTFEYETNTVLSRFVIKEHCMNEQPRAAPSNEKLHRRHYALVK